MTVANHSPMAISDGIKAVGIGRKGSKALTPELIQAIIRELREDRVPAAAKGAFFGALIIKGVTPEEKALEEALGPGMLSDFPRLVNYLACDAPPSIQELCVRLLRQETLDEDTARELGDFLLSQEPGDGARGLAASVLRVRYETPEEYAGILKSIQKTLEPPFRETVPAGEPVVQIVEPFDGVDHSYLVTPLLVKYIQGLGYRTVCLAGRNSGPKSGNNLLDLADALPVTFLKNNRDLQAEKPTFGWYIRQQDMSKAMDRWVDLRRQIIKRPFMATLERFVNPVDADILIASAFHPPYGEKMLAVAQKAGYPGIVILRNGLEGTLAFPLKRGVKILCA
ncbi:MAG: anthranilate phosphoribosyltransferase, partial [Candidatus Omnitrophica bacterium]|nr:anthranilate phosphoribosyltransferase [Candidatus Omnitrophota bacterium]